MKKIIIFFLAITFLSSCETITGDGNITEKNYGIYNNYKKVVIGKMISVNVSAGTPGNNKSVTIKTDKNLHEYIEVVEEDNTLFIKVRNGSKLEPNKLEVNIVTPQNLYIVNKNKANIEIDGLEYWNMNLQNEGSGKINAFVNDVDLVIDQSGSGDIDISGVNNRPIDANNSGSGNINIQGQQMDVITFVNSGSGDIILKGSSNVIDISNSGSGEVKSIQFSTQSANIKNSGSGNCYINVSDLLDVKISGSGDVKYMGSPQISEEISGSGELIKL